MDVGEDACGHVVDLAGHVHGLFEHAHGLVVPVEAVARACGLGAQGLHALFDVVAGEGGVGKAHGHERRVDGRIHLVHRLAHGAAVGGQPLRAVGRPLAAQRVVLRPVKRGHEGLAVGKAAAVEIAHAVRAEAGIIGAAQMGQAAVVVHPDEGRARLGEEPVARLRVGQKFRRHGAGGADGLHAVAAHHGLKRHGRTAVVGVVGLVGAKGGPGIDAHADAPGAGRGGEAFEALALFGDALQRLVAVARRLAEDDPQLVGHARFGGQTVEKLLENFRVGGGVQRHAPGNSIAFHGVVPSFML